MKLLPLLVMTSSAFAAPITYPETRRENVKDTYHGVEVTDPYRWLEDDNAAETKAWVKVQNAVTNAYLESIPEREAINKRITELYNYARYSLPSKKADSYFYSKNDGLQNQSPLYVSNSLTDAGKVLLDPNTLSEDGTVSLGGTSVSHDGKYLAYSISRSGSDWREIKVRDVKTGKDLKDEIKWVKFSGISWAADSSGFYYSRYDAPPKGEEFTQANEFHKLYFHKLGDSQEKDQLIYHRPDQAKWNMGGYATEDGRYLIVNVSSGAASEGALFYRNLEEKNSPVIPLLDKFDANYDYVTHRNNTLYIQTDLDAPRGRLVAIDLASPEKKNWKELIPESKDTLSSINHVGGELIAKYKKDARSVIQRFDLDGKPLGKISLPGLGSAGGFGGKPEDTETFYSYTSFNSPTTIYRYDFKTKSSTVYRQPKLTFDPNAFVSKQVFVSSKDGTKIPSFIVHKKGIKLDGSNPTLLYGYGGFNISLSPYFSPTLIQWMEMGGVYVMTNLRGGSEYGEDWHKAGMLKNKQNVFDDFIYTAEWLIKNNYTSSKKLAIAGGSNGGLLVGACMTQRPELFRAALPAVGVLDMLRYHKFTIGWAWVPEYGSSEDKELFPILHKYSPYHNLKKGTSYPSTMVLTSDHDDRVVPAHSFKFAAALQHAHKGDDPVLIRIEEKAGHGAGTPTSKRIESAADKHSFLLRELGMKLPEEK